MARHTLEEYFTSLYIGIKESSYFNIGTILRKPVAATFGRASDPNGPWGEFAGEGKSTAFEKNDISWRRANPFSWPFQLPYLISGGLRTSLWSVIDFVDLKGRMLARQKSSWLAIGLKALVGIALLPLEIPSYFLSKLSDVPFDIYKNTDYYKNSRQKADVSVSKAVPSTGTIASRLRESQPLVKPPILFNEEKIHTAETYLNKLKLALNTLTKRVLITSKDPSMIIKNLEENRTLINNILPADAKSEDPKNQKRLNSAFEKKKNYLKEINEKIDELQKLRARPVLSIPDKSPDSLLQPGHENQLPDRHRLKRR